MTDQTNPYAASASAGPASEVPVGAEAIRRKHLNHEASVKSIGSLYLLSAVFAVPASLVMVVSAASTVGRVNEPVAAVAIVTSLFYLGLSILLCAVAIGLRGLQTWARYIAVGYSVLGLLAIPIGTLINAYFLYLLLSEKGKVVFSDEYKEVIRQTPEIKYKTPVLVLLLAIVLIVLLVVSVIAFLSMSPS